MKTISRTHTKKIAAVKALPLLVIEYTTDVSDAPVKNWGTLADAWATFERDDWYSLTDNGDGSYRIGRKYSTRYELFPEGHRRHVEIEAHFARAAAYRAQREAKEAAEREQRRAEQLEEYAAMLPTLPKGKTPAISIHIPFSETGCFDDGGETFTGPNCWDEVNARAEQAKANRTARGAYGGYDKTDFTVTFADGETYSGRWDISNDDHDGHTLEAHILHCLAFHAGYARADHLTPEEYAHATQGKGAAALEFLQTYQIGPATTLHALDTITAALSDLGHTAQVSQITATTYAARMQGHTLSNGQPLILTGTPEQIIRMASRRAPVQQDPPEQISTPDDAGQVAEMTAEELQECQDAARAEWAGKIPDDLLELCLKQTAAQIKVTTQPAYLTATELPRGPRVLN